MALSCATWLQQLARFRYSHCNCNCRVVRPACKLCSAPTMKACAVFEYQNVMMIIKHCMLRSEQVQATMQESQQHADLAAWGDRCVKAVLQGIQILNHPGTRLQATLPSPTLVIPKLGMLAHFLHALCFVCAVSAVSLLFAESVKVLRLHWACWFAVYWTRIT